jgi:hypothetical protein
MDNVTRAILVKAILLSARAREGVREYDRIVRDSVRRDLRRGPTRRRARTLADRAPPYRPGRRGRNAIRALRNATRGGE